MSSKQHKAWPFIPLFILLPPLGLFFICRKIQWSEKVKLGLAAASSAVYILLLIFFLQSAMSRNLQPTVSLNDIESQPSPASELAAAATIRTAVDSILTGYTGSADIVQLPNKRFEICLQLSGSRFVSLSECQLTFNKTASRFYSLISSLKDIELIEINFICDNQLMYIISLRDAYNFSRDSFASHTRATNLSAEIPATPAADTFPAAESQTAAEEPTATEKPSAAVTTESPMVAKHNGSITLISITSPISTGKIATVTIRGKPKTEYDIKVKYSSSVSSAKGLENKISDESGTVSWSWRIGAKTKPGTFSVTVTGDGDTLVMPIVIAS